MGTLLLTVIITSLILELRYTWYIRFLHKDQVRLMFTLSSLQGGVPASRSVVRVVTWNLWTKNSGRALVLPAVSCGAGRGNLSNWPMYVVGVVQQCACRSVWAVDSESSSSLSRIFVVYYCNYQKCFGIIQLMLQKVPHMSAPSFPKCQFEQIIIIYLKKMNKKSILSISLSF